MLTLAKLVESNVLQRMIYDNIYFSVINELGCTKLIDINK